MSTRRSTGPSTESCGTPLLTWINGEQTLLVVLIILQPPYKTYLTKLKFTMLMNMNPNTERNMSARVSKISFAFIIIWQRFTWIVFYFLSLLLLT